MLAQPSIYDTQVDPPKTTFSPDDLWGKGSSVGQSENVQTFSPKDLWVRPKGLEGFTDEEYQKFQDLSKIPLETTHTVYYRPAGQQFPHSQDSSYGIGDNSVQTPFAYDTDTPQFVLDHKTGKLDYAPGHGPVMSTWIDTKPDLKNLPPGLALREMQDVPGWVSPEDRQLLSRGYQSLQQGQTVAKETPVPPTGFLGDLKAGAATAVASLRQAVQPRDFTGQPLDNGAGAQEWANWAQKIEKENPNGTEGQSWYNPSRIAHQTVRSAPGLAIDLTAAVVAKNPGFLASSYLRTYGEMTNAGIAQGLSPEEARSRATVFAGIGAAINSIPVARLFNETPIGKATFGKMLEITAKRAAANGVVMSAAGLVSTTADEMYKAAKGDPDAFKNMADKLGSSAVQGFITGAGLSVVHTVPGWKGGGSGGGSGEEGQSAAAPDGTKTGSSEVGVENMAKPGSLEEAAAQLAAVMPKEPVKEEPQVAVDRVNEALGVKTPTAPVEEESPKTLHPDDLWIQESEKVLDTLGKEGEPTNATKTDVPAELPNATTGKTQAAGGTNAPEAVKTFSGTDEAVKAEKQQFVQQIVDEGKVSTLDKNDTEAQHELTGLRESLKGPRFTGTGETGKQLYVREVEPATPEQKVAAWLAGKLGRRVVFYESNNNGSAGSNGSEHPNIILLNNITTRPVLGLLGHELTHSFFKTSPELYRKITDILELGQPGVIKANALDYVKNANDPVATLASFAARGRDAANSALHQEGVADSMLEVFQKPEFWKRLQERAPEVAKATRSVVAQFLKRIQELLGKSWGRVKDTTVLEKIADAIGEEIKERRVPAKGGEEGNTQHSELLGPTPILDSLTTKQLEQLVEKLDDEDFNAGDPNKQVDIKSELHRSISQKTYGRDPTDLSGIPGSISRNQTLQRRAALEEKLRSEVNNQLTSIDTSNTHQTLFPEDTMFAEDVDKEEKRATGEVSPPKVRQTGGILHAAAATAEAIRRHPWNSLAFWRDGVDKLEVQVRKNPFTDAVIGGLRAVQNFTSIYENDISKATGLEDVIKSVLSLKNLKEATQLGDVQRDLDPTSPGFHANTRVNRSPGLYPGYKKLATRTSAEFVRAAAAVDNQIHAKDTSILIADRLAVHWTRDLIEGVKTLAPEGVGNDFMNRYIDATVKANGGKVTTRQVVDFFLDVRKSLESSEFDVAQRKLSQERKTVIPILPSGVDMGGGVLGKVFGRNLVWALQDRPYEHLDNLRRQVPARLAYRTVFAPGGSSKTSRLAAQLIESNGIGAGEMFKNIVKAIHGIPQNDSMLDPGSLQGRVVKAMMIARSTFSSAAASAASPSVLVGSLLGPGLDLYGPLTWVKAGVKFLSDPTALERTAKIDRLNSELVFDPTSKTASVVKITNGVMAYPNSISHHLGGSLSGTAAQIIADSVQNGTAGSFDRSTFRYTAKLYKFPDSVISDMLNRTATPEMYDAYVRKAVKVTSGRNTTQSDLSPLENNSIFRGWFTFYKYPMNQMRVLDNVTRTTYSEVNAAVKTGDLMRGYTAVRALTAAYTGVAVRGYAMKMTATFLTGGLLGLKMAVKENDEDMKDSPTKWLAAMMTEGIGGPLNTALRIANQDNPMDMSQLNFNTALLYEMWQAADKKGIYRDMSYGDIVQKLALNRFRVGRVARTWWGIMENGEDDPLLDLSLAGNARYRKDKGLPWSEMHGEEDLDAFTSRKYAKLAFEDIKANRDPTDNVLKWLGSPDSKDISTKLAARRVLYNEGKPYTPEMLQELRQRIGDKAVDRLQEFDDTLSAWSAEYETAGSLNAEGFSRVAKDLASSPPSPEMLQVRKNVAGVERRVKEIEHESSDRTQRAIRASQE